MNIFHTLVDLLLKRIQKIVQVHSHMDAHTQMGPTCWEKLWSLTVEQFSGDVSFMIIIKTGAIVQQIEPERLTITMSRWMVNLQITWFCKLKTDQWTSKSEKLYHHSL